MGRDPAPAALRLFDRFFLPWMRTRIDVRIAGLPTKLDPRQPLILIANHVSWWDGFLLHEVHRALRPLAPFHTVMLESELRQHRLLRSLGAVGMNPESAASVTRCIRTLQGRLERRPDSIIAFFPQGRIWPSGRRPLGFRRGVELFARKLPGTLIVPIGIQIEPLNRISPTAFVSAGDPVESGNPGSGVECLESTVAAQLDLILGFLTEHGERAPDVWPSRFDRLLSPIVSA
jgi:1-acyl-sn-glycerol-3-phosphate acyltransferase